MKCLVVGGAGFIGSHILDALVDQGHEVRILDNLSTGKLENIQHQGQKMEFLVGDIRDWTIVEGACRDMDIVFHQAAVASVVQSLKDPQGTFEVNVIGTSNLLEAAGRAGVQHFIFASTAAVYGQYPDQVNSEILVPKPISHYGVSKLVGEEYGRFYAEHFDMRVTCLRYFNVYGTRQSSDSDYAGVISLFIHMLLSGGSPKVYGDGYQTRDFVNVADIVQANLLAMNNTSYRFEIFNIGTGQQSSVRDLLGHLGKIHGKPFQIHFEPERRGELRNSLSDIQKARHILGFEPKVSFYQGLKMLMEHTKYRLMAQEGVIQAGDDPGDDLQDVQKAFSV